jgi:hypothetical protein
MGCPRRRGLVLSEPREAVAIQRPLNFQQFGTKQGTLQYLGAVSVGRIEVKLAVVLVGKDPRLLNSELTKIFEGGAKKRSIPPLWDGRASERIVRALQAYLGS